MQSPVQPTSPNKRPTCPRCLRAQSGCICHWITPIANATEVLILQHPLEVGHAKNSAGLLNLSLAHSRIVVGEVFEALPPPDPGYTVLLYPPTVYPGHEDPAPLEPARLQDLCTVRLVLLDGTWRKSRKMLHLSPCLQRLPRLSLQGAPASRYTIRKAHLPAQLSTLEACCLALAQLAQDASAYAPLLNAFAGFVAQQADMRTIGREGGANRPGG
jgi:DTW domain-containing protein YfiP